MINKTVLDAQPTNETANAQTLTVLSKQLVWVALLEMQGAGKVDGRKVVRLAVCKAVYLAGKK